MPFFRKDKGEEADLVVEDVQPTTAEIEVAETELANSELATTESAENEVAEFELAGNELAENELAAHSEGTQVDRAEPPVLAVPKPKGSESMQPPKPDPSLPPEQGKWNPPGPQGERRPMNPVPRERLPYPDLPMQAPERQPDRPSDRQADRPSDRAPGRSPQQSAPISRTIVDRNSHFDGNFRSDTDLLIEGTFEGEIDCKGTVVVAEGANVTATVRARNAIVAGAANGDFNCDERLTVQATGELRGKAQAATLVVEEGAFFEGEFKMGAGGFSAIGSNFSSWQSGRSAKNSGPRNPGERREESENPGLDVGARSDNSKAE
jgi:cytoskeletal protein CcmA (bactofilin family)